MDTSAIARLDYERCDRTEVPEVVFAAGKTFEQDIRTFGRDRTRARHAAYRRRLQPGRRGRLAPRPQGRARTRRQRRLPQCPAERRRRNRALPHSNERRVCRRAHRSARPGFRFLAGSLEGLHREGQPRTALLGRWLRDRCSPRRRGDWIRRVSSLEKNPHWAVWRSLPAVPF